MTPALTKRPWLVRAPATEYAGFIPWQKAATPEEAAAHFRRTIPQADCYILRVHRAGSPRDFVEFPAVKRVAA